MKALSKASELKKLTLEEIGKIAGVSRATVSRVINNYPHISTDVRERVQKVITDTGYQPNMIARSLASDRSNIIGLVIPSHVAAVFTDPYFPRLIQGISQASNQRKLTLSLFLFHSREEEDITIKSIVNTGLIDGLIVTADRKEDSVVHRLMKTDMPSVVVGKPDRDTDDVYFVDTDNIAGGHTATQHLLSLGYRRIAIITVEHNTAGDDRLHGYMNALQAHDIEIDDNLIAYGDFSINSGAAAMKSLLSYQPDAVFICSDSMAMGAMSVLNDHGISVPDEMSIVSYDDLPPAVQTKPTLTTIRQPIAQSGQAAVELLVDLINNNDVANHHTVTPNQLVIRRSCGALNSNNSYNSENTDVIIDI